MFRKRLSVLVAAAMILVTLFAAASPGFANQGGTPPHSTKEKEQRERLRER